MIAYLPALLVVGVLSFDMLSFAMAAWQCRPRSSAPTPEDAPPVSIIRPLAGMESHLEEMLRSTFELDYPDFELLLCVQKPDDPVIDLAKCLIAAHPEVNARLLIGDDPLSGNPKYNNCLKGWDAARHELVAMADSNVLMPRDYLQQHLKKLGAGVAITYSPPIGARAENFWAELECAFLNTHTAKMYYTADALGLDHIQGKSMLIRRSYLDGVGGLRALYACVAEDFALREAVLAAGGRIRIVDAPFEQLLGKRSVDGVLRRQRRWAVMRRILTPQIYPFELLMGGVMLMLLAGLAALALKQDPWIAALCVGALNYLVESVVAWRLGWFHSWRTPLAWIVRDALLPLIWLRGLFDRGYAWGNFEIRVNTDHARLKGEPQ